MTVLNVLAIHGMGSSEGGFSDALRENVLSELERLGVVSPARPADTVLTWNEVLWSDIGDTRQRDLLTDLYPNGEWTGLRNFTVTNLGDILVYLSPSHGPCIKQRVMDTIQELREHHTHETGPMYISVVAHSLGSIVAYDLLHELTHYIEAEGGGQKYGLAHQLLPEEGSLPPVYLSNLFTFGSPLAVFSLFPDQAHHHYRAGNPPFQGHRPFQCRPGGRWLNFHDEVDYIAFRLEPLFRQLTGPSAELPFVEDIAADNSVLPLPWEAHTGYWANNEMARAIAGRLETDWLQVRT